MSGFNIASSALCTILSYRERTIELNVAIQNIECV